MKKIENRFIRELINEFIGTMILVLVGDSILAIIIAGENEPIAAIVGPVGWGTAIFVAVSIAGGVSSHLNPAVTLASASVRKLPFKKVPLYFASQYLGAFVGAALVYMLYHDQIAHFDKGVRAPVNSTLFTGNIFATYPKPHVSILTCFLDQVVGTGLLMLTVEAITDERNWDLPKSLHPIMLGVMIMALIFGFSSNCMAPLNPARDIAPRFFTSIAGWGMGVWSVRDWNYFWVPLVGPHIGAILGAWLYKLAIGDHFPDPVSRSPPVASSTYGFGTPSCLSSNPSGGE